MAMPRQGRRIQKAIDELIKIADDGYATSALRNVLDRLRELETLYAMNSARDLIKTMQGG